MSENYKAEALLAYVETEKNKLKEEMEEFKKKQRTRSDELSKVTAEAREVCVHPKIKITYDFDYHKREEWEEHHCEVCGKRIKRI